jgi:DNA-binding NarL/FixJ family response regulator
MRPTLRLIVLGGQDEPAFIEDAIAAGARGVLSHEASEASLRQALEVVRDGSVWAPRKILSRLLDRASEAPQSPATIHLTVKELDVVRMLVLGLSNREIAHALGVEPATIKGHLGRLMRKAAVRSRTALTLRAIEHRWG